MATLGIDKRARPRPTLEIEKRTRPPALASHMSTRADAIRLPRCARSGPRLFRPISHVQAEHGHVQVGYTARADDGLGRLCAVGPSAQLMPRALRLILFAGPGSSAAREVVGQRAGACAQRARKALGLCLGSARLLAAQLSVARALNDTCELGPFAQLLQQHQIPFRRGLLHAAHTQKAPQYEVCAPPTYADRAACGCHKVLVPLPLLAAIYLPRGHHWRDCARRGRWCPSPSHAPTALWRKARALHRLLEDLLPSLRKTVDALGSPLKVVKSSLWGRCTTRHTGTSVVLDDTPHRHKCHPNGW